MKLTDELLFNMDNDMVTGLAFFDFRKAFDVINHELLLKKLSIYGASDISLKWFGSHLTGKKQYVHVNGCCSTSKQLLQRSASRIDLRTYSLPIVCERHVYVIQH